MHKKFVFICQNCGKEVDGFKEWFGNMQKCPKCGKNHIKVKYFSDYNKIKELVSKNNKPENLWHYIDFLPLNDKNNIVTEGEGIAPMERWAFLEEYAARKYNLSIKVIVNRNDKSFATGTFKDKGASLAASALKENNINEYVVVSTGNTATAFAHYTAKAGISCSVFVPADSLPDSEAHIGTYGQKLFRVKGDYAFAKQVAAEYAKNNGLLITGGNLDPLRLEAKKTQVFEMMRVLDEMPTVYIQALSGGTGPFAVEKAVNELNENGFNIKLPKFLLCQGNRCAPQAHAWEKAKKNNFPEGFEKEYPIYENPKALIPTIATGNPALYPLMAKLVQKTEGEIFEVEEEMAVHIARLVAYERTVKVGPASAAGITGFFEALKRNFISDKDVIFINMGEGVHRASDFLKETAYTTEYVDNAADCKRFNRNDYKDFIWEPFENY